MPHDRVRFITLCGNVDMNIDEKFDLAREMTSIRGAGFYMSPSFYFPLTSILGVVTYDSQQAAEGKVGELSIDPVAKGKLN